MVVEWEVNWSEKKGVGLVGGGGGDGEREREIFFFFVMWILVAFCWFGTLCSRYPSAGVGLGIGFVSISTYLIMSVSPVLSNFSAIIWFPLQHHTLLYYHVCEDTS